MSGDWMLVETLASDLEPSVVAVGEHPKQWTPLASLRRWVGPAAAGLAVEAIRQCRDTGLSVRLVDGDRVAVAEPVHCAFGGVHGVELWTGTDGAPVPPRRPVAAWDWEADTELAYHGPGLEELVFARDPARVEVVRTPPDAFGRMVRFDGRVDYFAMVSRLDLGGNWQGEVDMAGDDDRVRHFQMITRARPGLRRISALMHDIPVLSPAEAVADPDVTILRAVSQRSGVGVGIIELSTALIYEWAGEPLPPLDRWAVERPTVDPDDLTALRTACAEVAERPGMSRRLTLRVRFATGDWVLAQVELVSMTIAGTGHGLLRVWAEDPAHAG